MNDLSKSLFWNLPFRVREDLERDVEVMSIFRDYSFAEVQAYREQLARAWHQRKGAAILQHQLRGANTSGD